MLPNLQGRCITDDEMRLIVEEYDVDRNDSFDAVRPSLGPSRCSPAHNESMPERTSRIRAWPALFASWVWEVHRLEAVQTGGDPFVVVAAAAAAIRRGFLLRPSVPSPRARATPPITSSARPPRTVPAALPRHLPSFASV